MQFSRRLYKRGASYEITIPKALLFNLDKNKKNFIYFFQKDSNWQFSFNKPSQIFIKRSIYKRGSSFETTLPLPMLLNLNPTKHYNIIFNLDKTFSISLEEVK